MIDVGAGTGLIGIELQKLGYSNLHALDISPEMLKEEKKRNIYKRFFCVALTDVLVGTLLAGHIRAAALDEMVRIVKHGMNVVVFFSLHMILSSYKKECHEYLST